MIVHLTSTASLEVASLREASDAVTKHWGAESYHVFYADPKTGVVEEGGVPIAHVSYNGRVWEARKGGKEIPL